MEFLIENLYNNVLNQPIVGLIVLVVYIIYHESITAGQKTILEGVQKYLIKFESDESQTKQKRINEVVEFVKIKVTIIIMGLDKYIHTKENEQKDEQLIVQEMLDIASKEMAKTWSDLQAKGFHVEVITMKELSELLMPFYRREMEGIAKIYKTPALNGNRMAVVEKMIVAFENTVLNTWERKFRMMCSANL